MAVTQQRSGGGMLRTLSVAVVSLGLFAGVWWTFLFLSLPLVSAVGSAAIATLVTAVTVILGVKYGRAGGGVSLRGMAYLLAMGVVSVVFLATVFLVVVVVLVFAVGAGLAIAVTTVLTFVLASVCLAGVLLSLRDMDDQTDWALNLRMAIAVLLLALCTLVFCAAVWGLSLFALGIFLPPSLAYVFATAGVVWMLAKIAHVEYQQILTVEDGANATPVTADQCPELYARVTRLASQLDVPAPTVALADRSTPEAMVVGFRPEQTHLVLSTGTLDALSAEELDAVIAHELAHVANRDAMVMTVVSAPVVIAEGLLQWSRGEGYGTEDTTLSDPEQYDDDPIGDHTELTEAELYGEDGEWRLDHPPDDDESDDDEGNPLLLFTPLAAVTWGIGRVIVAVLSRTRETVADQTAAEVTGSPAALAGALRTLDTEIEAVPDRDLREAAAVSSLSILPLDDSGGVVRSDDGTPVGPGRNLSWLDRTIDRVRDRLFSTHPPTQRRVEQLVALEREGETAPAERPDSQ